MVGIDFEETNDVVACDVLDEAQCVVYVIGSEFELVEFGLGVVGVDYYYPPSPPSPAEDCGTGERRGEINLIWVGAKSLEDQLDEFECIETEVAVDMENDGCLVGSCIDEGLGMGDGSFAIFFIEQVSCIGEKP